MRLSSNQPLDPEVQTDLDAIDATLRGDAVLPAYAELAEVALLLRDERPAPPREEFTRELDAKVARRFQPEPSVNGQATRSDRRGWRRIAGPMSAATAVLAAAVIGLIVIVGGNANNNSSSVATTAGSGANASTFNGAASGSGSSGAAAHPKSAGAGAHASNGSSSALSQARTLQGTANGATLGAAASGSLSSQSAGIPAQNSAGRRIEQSTQIQLSAGNDHIDAVSQEIFNVASAEDTIVQRSHVAAATANGGGSFATFTLNVPDGNLQTVMDRLSSLHYANVVSRQQTSEDVTNQYNDDKRALNDAEALRTSLLKQLAGAYTTGQIDSLKAQIQTAEGRIRADEAQLNRIEHATSYTTVSVQVNAAAAVAHSGKHAAAGFSIGRGAHDALRVLVVAAGVALIVLAALIPLALLAALVAWIVYWIRNRRREHALDQA